MYKVRPYKPTLLKCNTELKEGESMEEKMIRLQNGKEPVKDTAPLLFTQRGKGVNPAYNIRTDRWEIAVDIKDKLKAMEITKKQGIAKTGDTKEDGKTVKGDFGKPEPTQGTTEKVS